MKHWFIPTRKNGYKPYFLRRENVLVLAALSLLFFAGAFSMHHALLTRGNSLAAVISSVVVSLTNEDRAEEGLSSLAVSPTLSAAAQMKAEDMAAKGYFAHTSPEGLSPWHWMNEAGYAFSYAGENLAVHFSDSHEVEEAWMDSPGHRANILNGRFTEIGIGIAEGEFEGRKTTFVVQMFGRPVSEVPTGAVANIPDEEEIFETVEPVIEEAGEEEAVAEVEGEAVEVLSETPQFIAVRNSEVVATGEGEQNSIHGGTTPLRSTWREIMTSPQTLLTYFLYTLLALIFVALTLSALIKIRVQHRSQYINAFALSSLLLMLLLASFTLFVEPVVATL